MKKIVRMAEKWIFDNDGGLDDTYALVLALSQPDKFTLPCITVASGNVSVTTAAKAVARTLEICKCKVPIYLGAAEGIVEGTHHIPDVHGADGQGDAAEYSKLEGYTDCIKTDMNAIEAIIKTVNENAGNISIVATGPLTNVALALKMDPSIAKKVKRFVSMGGAHHARGNTLWGSEFNYYCDPEAAEICIRKMPFIEILTVENGNDFPLSVEDKAKWHNPATVKGHFLEAISAYIIKNYGRIFIFDAIAVAIAMDPTVISKAIKVACKIEMHGADTRGLMLIDWHHKKTYPCEGVMPTVVLDTHTKEVTRMLIESTNI